MNREGFQLTPNTDEFTGFDVGITGDHNYIHRGKAFTALIAAGSISAAYKISFTTPADKYIHWRPLGITSSTDYVGAELYEGDNYSGGSAVTPVNRNRNNTAVSGMSMVKASTVTPAGTLIDIDGFGTTGNPTARTGGGAGANEELVLKPSTKYTLVLTPAGATVVNAKLFWYEEDYGV